MAERPRAHVRCRRLSWRACTLGAACAVRGGWETPPPPRQPP